MAAMDSTSRRSVFAMFAVMLAACASTADDEKSRSPKLSSNACPSGKCPEGPITEVPVRCPW
jgi:hypothetical protein